MIALLPFGAAAETIRIATYHTELSRKGPGLLLHDILGEKDAQVNAVASVISHISPDVILLLDFDFDYDLVALKAFGARLGYPHAFARMPNSGLETGLDMDGDGRLGGPRDAQSFGYFTGQGGMAVLSRLPILADEARDFSQMLWRDIPQAQLPVKADGAPFYSDEALALLRLSSVGHWDVPFALPDGTIAHLLAYHAGTPVFDGPEDRNGLRNADEQRLWRLYLDGALPGIEAPNGPLILAGSANLDPEDGAGKREAIKALLAHPRLVDPMPKSEGARLAGDSGVNADHRGDPALDTADWKDEGNSPGNLRVDYLLPSTEWEVIDAGVLWPAPDDPEAEILGSGKGRASRHALTWVDLRR
ncbi:MAG: hypothetical protein ACJA06_000185 [Halocynthiibacter sp.]